MDIIDEFTSPGGCTWSVYRGPLIVDFAVPLESEVNQRVPGRTRAEDITVSGDLDTEEGDVLEIREPDGCDTVEEMRRAIMRGAFPQLARVLYDHDSDSVTPDDVRHAAATDLAEHAIKVESVGVTFGEGSELLRTRIVCYHCGASSNFAEITPAVADDFCCGLTSLPAGRGDTIRLAYVHIAFRAGRRVSARLSAALKLRVDDNGIVIPAHRADAYTSESQTADYHPLHQRRNDVVEWTMSEEEREAIQRLVGCPLDCAQMG
jgi:hypothetical protein